MKHDRKTAKAIAEAVAAEKELARLRSEAVPADELARRLEAVRAVLLRAPERYADRLPMEREAAVKLLREAFAGPLEELKLPDADTDPAGDEP